MATRYKATQKVECWKEHTCIRCGSTFRYLFKIKKTGRGQTKSAAEAAAHNAVVRALDNDVEMQPCPSCGLYQPDMVGDDLATNQGCVLIPVAALVIILTFVAALASFGVFALPLYLLTWIAVGVCMLGALAHLWVARRNPNRNMEANREKAQEQILKKSLKLVKPGQAEQSLAAPEPWQISSGHKLAFLLLFLGIGIVATAEITRLASGWPLNRTCDPVVVGPGDDSCVYLPHEVNSIKGLWHGSASVAVLNAKELGLTNEQLPAVSKSSTWGERIIGKHVSSENSPIWTSVTIPDTADLAGKDMRLHIEMQVRYPAAHGLRSFQDEQQDFEDAVDLHLASPHAGILYRALWWGGWMIGGALVVLMGLRLRQLENRRKQDAQPAKVISIEDEGIEDIPEVLPAE